MSRPRIQNNSWCVFSSPFWPGRGSVQNLLASSFVRVETTPSQVACVQASLPLQSRFPGYDIHRVGWAKVPHMPDLPVARQNQICLSGHTHGGQVTLFGRPFWTPRGSGRFVAGWYETPSCRLYVSRGVGMSILPIRFGARPEVAVFEL